MKNYAILINTCDKFEDCWDPFFKLWTIYWKNFTGKIYLNTEYKNYSYPGLDITAIRGSATNNISKSQSVPWSQCLKWALNTIDSDIILYMQEDYFLTDKVNNEWIEYFFEIIKSHIEIPCIHLTSEGIPAVAKSQYDKLCISEPEYFSYVSCQASFWRKDILLSLLREHETAWNFEWWGSKRAKILGYTFLVVDPNWMKCSNVQIIPYIFTGVIGGKWFKPVVEVFKKHEISLDYTKRGFYNVDLKYSLKKRIKTKLSIWNVMSIIDIWKMKFKKSQT